MPGHPDVEVLALAQRDARLVVQAHQPEHRSIGEAEVGQAVQRDPAEAEQHVAGVDRLGDAVLRPERRSVAALAVVVLDVVVDEAEVVAELDRGGAGQRATVVARDRGVGEEAQQRPHPLAGRARAVEPEVVAAHLVDAGGRRIGALDEAQDLRLGVGDQLRDVRAGRERHRGECTQRRANVLSEGSGFVVPEDRARGVPSRRARAPTLRHRGDRPVALRLFGEADRILTLITPGRRQDQGDRQGHPPPEVAHRRQPRALRRAARSRSRRAERSRS